MKDSHAESLQNYRIRTPQESDCKKSRALCRQTPWCRCRAPRGSRIVRMLLVLIAMICSAGIMLICRKAHCCTAVSTEVLTTTFAKITGPTASSGPPMNLNWTTCPSHQELRTGQHFTLWDKSLIQELRTSSHSLPKMEEESWYAVTDGIHVFSAFLTTTVERAIHVVSLVQFRYSNGTSIEQPPLVCTVRTSAGVFERKARIHPVWTWLEPRLKSAFILCPAPSFPEGDIQVAISVRGSSKRLPVWIPVHRPPEKSQEKCCAVCVRPTFGPSISLWKVAEFIAHYRLVGARHIYIYDLETSDELKMLLSHLQGQGVDITVVPFKLLADSSEVHAHGQMAGLYDCMFRSMSKSEYFIHVDLDELMVPSQYSDIPAMVYGVEATDGADVVGSIVVRSTFYCAEYPLSTLSVHERRVPLQTRMFTIHTGYVPFGDVTKYVGRTRTICNAGVHGVEQHCGRFKGIPLPAPVVVVNHYRRCCEFTSFDPVERWGFKLWTPSELFLDDMVKKRADAIEKELAIMGLPSVLSSTGNS